jgi:outer membrane protein assembly factor BamB
MKVQLSQCSLVSAALVLTSTSAAVSPLPGWPVTTGFSVSPSPTAAQMDGDAELEIVIASQDQKLYVYNADGSILPGWPKSLGSTLWPDEWAIINSSPAIANLDADPEFEIVVGSNDSRLYAFNRDGTSLPEFPYDHPAGFMIFSTPAIGDVDGDGGPEIVFGDNTGRVYALKPNATLLPGFPYITPYAIRGNVALGNLDGDAALEIVIPSEAGDPAGDLYAINGDGTSLAGFPLNLTPGVGNFSSPALGDLDLDGSLDIVQGTRNGMLYAIRADGTTMPGWPVASGFSFQSSPALVDLDNDPQLEIVIGINDSKVLVYNHNGTLLPGWPQTTSYTVISSPSIGDIDGDGRLEIVVGENTGKVYGFEIDGSPVAGFPLTSPTYTVYSSPLLSDVNLDGSMDILVGCNDTKVYAWHMGAGTFDPELQPWPEFRGDPRKEARLNRPAYATITSAPKSLAAGETALIDVNLTSITTSTTNLQVWTRVFNTTAEIEIWPNADAIEVFLAAGASQAVKVPLHGPCAVAASSYLVQIYLGEQGCCAFDTAAFDVALAQAVAADLNCDGDVNGFDLALLLGQWGPCPRGCGADLDGNGVVNGMDLAVLLAAWNG